MGTFNSATRTHRSNGTRKSFGSRELVWIIRVKLSIFREVFSSVHNASYCRVNKFAFSKIVVKSSTSPFLENCRPKEEVFSQSGKFCERRRRMLEDNNVHSRNPGQFNSIITYYSPPLLLLLPPTLIVIIEKILTSPVLSD